MQRDVQTELARRFMSCLEDRVTRYADHEMEIHLSHDEHRALPRPGTLLLSHGDTCTISLTLPGDVIDDPDETAECVEESLAEVLALARS